MKKHMEWEERRHRILRFMSQSLLYYVTILVVSFVKKIPAICTIILHGYMHVTKI